jgi:outer membrane protein
MAFVATFLTLCSFIFTLTKIGVVNPQKVLSETIRGKQVRDKLEKIRQNNVNKLKQYKDEIQKLEKELLSPALNSEARASKNNELQNKKITLRRLAEDADRNFKKTYQKEMVTLSKEILPIIETIGKSKGYTIILDISSAGISYFDKTTDITDEVIKEYNKKYAGK